MRWYGPDFERTEWLLQTLDHAAARGVRHVNFTGGEPTLHPDFARLCEHAKSLGMTTYIGTNGTMLAREDFARLVTPLLDEVSLSLHGPDASMHDAMTAREGSFAFLRAAARHVRLFNPYTFLMANIVVIRDNFATAADTVRLAASWGVKQALLSNVAPEGAAKDDYGRFAVRLDDWRTAVPEISRAAAETGVVLRFFGLPLCALGPDHVAQANDLHWAPRATVERSFPDGHVEPHGEKRSIKLATIVEGKPTRNRIKTQTCQLCAADSLCGGFFAAYHAVFGDAELRPLS